MSDFVVDDIPWQGGRISKGIVCVRANNPSPMTYVGSNSWIVVDPEAARLGNNRCVVIDPSPAGEQVERILDVCKDYGFTVGAIFLTHDHHDHTEGAVELSRLTGADIYGTKQTMGADTAGGPFEVDHCFKEGFLRPFEGAPLFEIYSLPGHSSDSVGLLVSEERIMFVGDLMFRHGPTVVFYPEGNLADYFASLDLVEELIEFGKIQLICPGHGYVIDDPSGIIQATRDHRMERLDQIKDALAAGVPAEANALFDAVYEGVDERLRWASLRSIEAQLEYLGLSDQGLV